MADNKFTLDLSGRRTRKIDEQLDQIRTEDRQNRANDARDEYIRAQLQEIALQDIYDRRQREYDNYQKLQAAADNEYWSGRRFGLRPNSERDALVNPAPASRFDPGWLAAPSVRDAQGEAQRQQDLAAENLAARGGGTLLSNEELERQAAQYTANANRAQTAAENLQRQRIELGRVAGQARTYGYEKNRNAPDFADLSRYQTTATGEGREVRDLDYNTGKTTGGTHREYEYGDLAYDFINQNRDAAAQWSYNAVRNNAGLLGMDNRELRQMTPDEIAMFNYLYAKDTEAGDQTHKNAYDYIRFIQSDPLYASGDGTLNARQRAEETEQAAAFAQEHPVAASVGTVLANPLKAITYLSQAADYLNDGKMEADAGYNRYSYLNSAARDAVTKQIEKAWIRKGKSGKAATFLYQTGMSMADFLFNTAITGGFAGGGAASEAFALTLMGTEAAADATMAAKDRGLDDAQAFAIGTIAGAAEIITEKFSIEALLNNVGRAGLSYWLKNAFTEGAEEIGSDFINLFADVLIAKDKGEWQAAIDAYVARGYSEIEAFSKAVADQARQMGASFLGGALSGGFMGGAGAVYIGFLNNAKGAAYQAQARLAGTEMDALRALTEAGLQSADAEVVRLSQNVKDRLDAGKKVSNRAVGRLAYELDETLGETEDEEPAAGPSFRQWVQEEGKRRATDERAATAPWRYTPTINAAEDVARVRQGAFQERSTAETPAAEARPTLRSLNTDQIDRAAASFGKEGGAALRANYNSDVSPSEYFRDFSRFYNAGITGRSTETMDMGVLTPEQRVAAYEAGAKDQTATAKATASANVGFHDSTGLVGRSTSAVLDKLAKLTRTSIEIDPNVDDLVNGQIIGNRIILQKASDFELIKTAKHEITHRLQELAPEAYKTYRDFALNTLAENGDVDALVRRYQQDYKRVGQNLSPAQAMDEIAADFTEALVTEAEKGSTETFEKLAAHDAKAANGFVRAIRDFIARVKRAFSGRQADEVSRNTFGVGLDKLEQAAKLWDDLLQKGEQAAQGLGVEANENAASEETAGKFSTKAEVLALQGVDWVGNKVSIKTQLQKHENELNQMAPVAVVEYNGIRGDLVSSIMYEVARIGGPKMKRGPVTFEFNEKGAESIDSHARYNEDRAAALASPYVAKYGKLISGQENHENSGLTTLTYGAPVVINGSTVNVGVVIQFESNGKPRAVNVGHQSGKPFRIDMKKAPDGPRSRVNRYGQGTSLPSPDAFNKKVTHPGEEVKKYSLKQLDSAYLSAVESGDMETAQRMVDEAAERAMPETKVRTPDGKLMPVYHGTKADFTVFDTKGHGGVNGTAEGYGIYLTDMPIVASAYGDRKIAGYADIKRPAYGDRKTIKRSELVRLIKEICTQEAQRMVQEDDYASVKEALPDTWVSNYVYTPDYPSMSAVYSDVADLLLRQDDNDANVIYEIMSALGIRDYDRAMDFYHDILTPITGIDGIWQKWKVGKQGTDANIILAFSSDQIKSNEPVTYDNAGNVIPLSERFNQENPDIRYSLKDSTGAALSETQRRYFSESRAIDEDGNLIRLYHGTTQYDEITKFKRSRTGWLGPGIYLTARQDYAKRYADEMGEGNGTIYELYANVTNPITVTGANPVPEILRAIYGRDSVYKARSEKQGNDTHIITSGDIKKAQAKGYDGIIWKTKYDAEVSVFSPEQVKRADNEAPTTSPDVRYSIKNIRDGSNYSKNSLRNSPLETMQQAEAAQRALERENNDLRERVAYWKGQTRRSNGVKTNPAEVKRAARRIARYYSSDADITAELQELYDWIANGGQDVSGEEANRRARAIADKVVDSALETEAAQYDMYGDLRDYLRRTELTISPEDRANIQDYNDWRKQYFGRMNLKGGSTNIDSVYMEMSELWPELFPDSITHPADQLLQIAEVADQIYTVTEHNPFAGYEDEAAVGIANEILETFFDLPQVKPTFADYQARKLAAEKAKGAEKLRALRAQKNEQIERITRTERDKRTEQADRLRRQRDEAIAKLREQNRETVRRALARSMETRERQLSALKERYAKSQAKSRDARSAREIRGKILRHSRALSEKLMRPTDKAHIPEVLQKPVAELLAAINQESLYTVDRNGKRVRNDSGDPTKRTQAFRALKERYEQILKQPGEFEGVIDPDLMDNLTDVIAMKDVKLAEMSLSQLDTVWKTLKGVEASVNTWNKTFAAARFATVSEAAEAIREENADKQERTQLRGFLGSAQTLTGVDMMTPEAYFHRLGKPGDALFREMRNAQDKQITILKAVSDYTTDALKGTDARKLEQEMHTVTLGGESVQMSTAQLMELYVLMRREQARQHILVGGILPEAVNTRGLKKVSRAEPVRGITVEEIAEATGKLTDKQRAVAEALQSYASTELSRYGNEASMQVYGYKKFGEEFYWPIRSNKQEVKTDIGKDIQAPTVSNKGMTKLTVPNANNSVLIGSIFDTFTQHSTEMATYAAWLAASEDVNRVRNFTFWDDVDGARVRTGSVKGILDRVYGSGGSRYLGKLLEDIANGVNNGDAGFFDRLTGSYKASAVGANLRVIIQQPTAILRALDMIDLKYMTSGLAANPLRGWRKATEYAPIAQWKDWGYFDVSTGRSMKDVMFQATSRLEKARNAMMAPAGWADSVSWGYLWNAVEREIRATTDLTGAEFDQAVAARFTEIVDRTQVVDGILQRSQIMRKGGINKMATAFMAEPTKQYNMLLTSAYDARHSSDAAKRAAKIRLARTAAALLASGVVNAAAQAIIDALRDSDREKDYWEKWMDAFVGKADEQEKFGKKLQQIFLEGNLGSQFMPLNYIPYIKDAVSLVQGYDVGRMDMESIASFIKAAGNMIKALNGEGKLTTAGALANIFGEASRMLGIPAANARRDAEALAAAIIYSSGNYVAEYRYEKWSKRQSTNKNTFYDILYNAYKDDFEAFNIIYNDMLAGGEFVSSDKSAAEAIASAMESRMKEEAGVSSVKDLANRFTPDVQVEIAAVPNAESAVPDEAQQKAAEAEKEQAKEATREADRKAAEARANAAIENNIVLTPARIAYNEHVEKIQDSALWPVSGLDDREEILELIDEMTSGSGDRGKGALKTVAAGADVGMTEDLYLLYDLAWHMADKANDGNGSLKQSEFIEAMKNVDMTPEQRTFLWNRKWKPGKMPDWTKPKNQW